MRDYVAQIKVALNHGLYYLALGSCLTLPDMCSALEAPDGTTNSQRYAAWVDQNLGPRGYQDFLDGIDCWGLRCSLLHQGRFIPHKGQYERVIFTEPRPPRLHRIAMRKALNLDLAMFCADMLEAVESWLSSIENTELFQSNYDYFMRRYPEGLHPYITGIPVIT